MTPADIEALCARLEKMPRSVFVTNPHIEAAAALREQAGEIERRENDYTRIIKEVLSCDPLPASSRPHDDQLEPPWEVIARVRAERDALRAEFENAKGHWTDDMCRLRSERDALQARVRELELSAEFDAASCRAFEKIAVALRAENDGLRKLMREANESVIAREGVGISYFMNGLDPPEMIAAFDAAMAAGAKP